MFDRKVFFVKERVAIVRLTDTWDILDPETKQPIAVAQERIPPALKALRLLINKRLLPTTVVVSTREGGPPLLTIKRGISLLHATVQVLDANGTSLGSLKSKLFSIGGAFRVFDPAGTEVALVQGNFIGWNFELKDANGRRLGAVTKKWAGVGKELFTTADNYVIAIEKDGLPTAVTALLLAAGLAIDTVFKEK
ncbi:MAG: hypothetical protein K1X31_10795 [Gemmatimonadaceae bacterium]|nr:hypothetical protein [Gemmatimonadaceae bacterium]